MDLKASSTPFGCLGSIIIDKNYKKKDGATELIGY